MRSPEQSQSSILTFSLLSFFSSLLFACTSLSNSRILQIGDEQLFVRHTSERAVCIGSHGTQDGHMNGLRLYTNRQATHLQPTVGVYRVSVRSKALRLLASFVLPVSLGPTNTILSVRTSAFSLRLLSSLAFFPIVLHMSSRHFQAHESVTRLTR